jgi:hypothetical protein
MEKVENVNGIIKYRVPEVLDLFLIPKMARAQDPGIMF